MNTQFELIKTTLDHAGSKAARRPELSNLRVSDTTDLADPDAVWEYMETLEVRDGWVQTTGTVIPIFNQTKLARVKEVPLSAELRVSQNRSVHIRQHPEGGWRAVCVDRDDGDKIVTIQKYFVDGDRKRQVVYEVLWEEIADLSGRLSLRPNLFRFAGFTSPREGE